MAARLFDHDPGLHADDSDMSELLDLERRMWAVARRMGLGNPHDNNAIRELLVRKVAGLRRLEGRGGADALEPDGSGECEIKTTGLREPHEKPKFCTSRLTSDILARYDRMVAWYFGTFFEDQMLVVHRVAGEHMTGALAEIRAKAASSANNPKFNWDLVRPHAHVVYAHPKYVEPHLRTRDRLRASADAPQLSLIG